VRYQLAIKKNPEDWKDEHLTIIRTLSPEQLSVANERLADWQPGQ